MGDDLINPGEREVREAIDRAPLSRNQFAQELFVLFGVVVELTSEYLGLAVAENAKRAQIAMLFVKLPLFAAQHCLTPEKAEPAAPGRPAPPERRRGRATKPAPCTGNVPQPSPCSRPDRRPPPPEIASQTIYLPASLSPGCGGTRPPPMDSHERDRTDPSPASGPDTCSRRNALRTFRLGNRGIRLHRIVLPTEDPRRCDRAGGRSGARIIRSTCSCRPPARGLMQGPAVAVGPADSAHPARQGQAGSSAAAGGSVPAPLLPAVPPRSRPPAAQVPEIGLPAPGPACRRSNPPSPAPGGES